MTPEFDASLRAGAAVFNAGDHHAAHDAWEEPWLDLEAGTDDERLLHGLIQYAAALHHARDRNWAGATTLAPSARDYLDLPEDYRGVELAPVRRYLAALERDPEVVERRGPPRVRVDGEAPTLGELPFESGAVAARVYAEAGDWDESVIEDAIRYAERALADGSETDPFVTHVLDFARDGAHRGIVYQRLSERVERERQKEADVDGLFE